MPYSVSYHKTNESELDTTLDQYSHSIIHTNLVLFLHYLPLLLTKKLPLDHFNKNVIIITRCIHDNINNINQI